MPRPQPSASSLRKLGFAIERVWQGNQRRLASAWSRARTRGRDPELEELAGRRCFCDPAQAEHLVHSDGLREACDLVVDLGCTAFPSGRFPWPVARIATLAPTLGAGTTIYAKTDRLQEWVSEFLPRLQRPIVLVTSDSDISPVAQFSELLEHPMLSHWFVQNCDIVGGHPKLTRIPIGLDNPVFTVFEKRVELGVKMALGKIPLDWTFSKNPKGDQAAIQAVKKTLPPSTERPALCLCTFHQNQIIVKPDVSDVPARAEALRELSSNPSCFFIERRLPQKACWELHGRFAFEISPHGHGLDCYRTWESIYLGTIPIVKTSTLDPLYEDNGLPVVIVKSWSEVTPTNLALWQKQFASVFRDGVPAVTLDYWVSRICRASAQAAVAF